MYDTVIAGYCIKCHCITVVDGIVLVVYREAVSRWPWTMYHT